MIAHTPETTTTPDTEETAIGTLAFADGAPSKDTVEKVYDYLDLMHGVESFVSAHQGASVAALFKGFEEARRAEQHDADLLRTDGCEVPVP